MLDKERRYYNEHRHKLRQIYQNKFLVVVGKKIIGIYDTHADAYADSRKVFDVGAFLICNTALPHRI
ncbi:hypothetical protein [Polluticoccus soli]|uniref:hypothetical protein n=1 Tax=Polluticoccus soli TaxID=3034150 RepID=UPI0023E15920|nr:hypothetical protein [Flavipsychrobacter sp. JY13-12]